MCVCVYFQGYAQPELSSLDSATGGRSLQTNGDTEDEPVNSQELYQKKYRSGQLNSSHEVSIKNIYT